LKRSSASVLPGLWSGCSSRASLRYAFLISSAEADFDTPERVEVLLQPVLGAHPPTSFLPLVLIEKSVSAASACRTADFSINASGSRRFRVGHATALAAASDRRADSRGALRRCRSLGHVGRGQMGDRLMPGRVEGVALLAERGEPELGQRRGELLGDRTEGPTRSPWSRARSRSSSTGSSALSTLPVACSAISPRSRSTRFR